MVFKIKVMNEGAGLKLQSVWGKARLFAIRNVIFTLIIDHVREELYEIEDRNHMNTFRFSWNSPHCREHVCHKTAASTK